MLRVLGCVSHEAEREEEHGCKDVWWKIGVTGSCCVRWVCRSVSSNSVAVGGKPRGKKSFKNAALILLPELVQPRRARAIPARRRDEPLRRLDRLRAREELVHRAVEPRAEGGLAHEHVELVEGQQAEPHGQVHAAAHEIGRAEEGGQPAVGVARERRLGSGCRLGLGSGSCGLGLGLGLGLGRERRLGVHHLRVQPQPQVGPVALEQPLVRVRVRARARV